MRWVLALMLVTGCDFAFRIDEIHADGTLGRVLVGSNVMLEPDSLAVGAAEVFLVSGAADAEATQVWLEVRTGNMATTVDVGLYDDVGAKPTNLLAQGSIAIPPGDTEWHSGRLDAAFHVTKSTAYWIALCVPINLGGGALGL